MSQQIIIAIAIIIFAVLVLVLVLKLFNKSIDKKIYAEIKKTGAKTIVEKIYIDEKCNLPPKNGKPGLAEKLIERDLVPYDCIGSLQDDEEPHIEISYCIDSENANGYCVRRTARLSGYRRTFKAFEGDSCLVFCRSESDK